jgi:hypothetical protein
MANCVQNHRCSSPAEKYQMPTRLIDVGSGNENIHLVVTADLPTIADYMTLSHFWGTTTDSYVMPTLKVDNLHEMKRNIPHQLLSKTFQDAIYLTRQLGCRYIWIDALCIIQDSVEDWGKESATMSSVYSGSMLNIAATAAENGEQGCFRNRNPLLVRRCIVRIRSENFAWNDGGNFFNIDAGTDFWWRDVENSPLAKRGWVLQERILAPRTLHFGSHQMFWECCETRASERDPEPKRDRRNVVGSAPLKNDTVIDPRRFWTRIVSEYTKASLTVETDKLVAISAVARLLQSKTDDEYYAGLWRKDPVTHLLWHRPFRSFNLTSRRPSVYRAPTWSWASWDGPIYVASRSHCPLRSKGFMGIMDI